MAWRFVNSALGFWLMVAPAILKYGSPAQTNDRILGPIIATFAVVAMWEATRAWRWVNLPLGIWLVVAPWVLSYGATAPIANDMIAGALIALFTVPGGISAENYGGGWIAVFRSTGKHQATPTRD